LDDFDNFWHAKLQLMAVVLATSLLSFEFHNIDDIRRYCEIQNS